MEIDDQKRRKEVVEITQSDYLKKLQYEAEKLRYGD
jgi:hypothetical protein